MKLIFGRLFSLLTIVLLFSGIIYSATPNPVKVASNKQKAHLTKHQLTENPSNFFEDIEEDEVDDESQHSDSLLNSDFFRSHNFVFLIDSSELNSNYFYTTSNITTSIPRWLYIRHILL